jgi:hypothetical protein
MVLWLFGTATTADVFDYASALRLLMRHEPQSIQPRFAAGAGSMARAGERDFAHALHAALQHERAAFP